MELLRKPISLIVKVLIARTEGTSLNAACRIFGIAKNTLLLWENRMSPVKDALLIYSLSQSFISQVIEGDELYTKVYENKPVEDCEGWTVMLMERANRFIWAMSCGEKDEKLFLNAMEKLVSIIRQTKDITLLTDGERRYGNILFDICHEIIKTSLPGRPKKTLPEGVKVRLKNKGSRSHVPGRKRKKYEAPQKEHPDTIQDINQEEIHANHLEGQNAATRRKLSAYRRKTNTYAKSKPGLQRVLNLYWVVHNFIRIHFTTKVVPAVGVNILASNPTWENILMLDTC